MKTPILGHFQNLKIERPEIERPEIVRPQFFRASEILSVSIFQRLAIISNLEIPKIYHL